MALPPIVTNSPIFKAITGTQSRLTQPSAPAPVESGSATRDTVSLSEESIQKLEALQTDIKSAQTARDAAVNLRQDLEANTEITLGYTEEAEQG